MDLLLRVALCAADDVSAGANYEGEDAVGCLQHNLLAQIWALRAPDRPGVMAGLLWGTHLSYDPVRGLWLLGAGGPLLVCKTSAHASGQYRVEVLPPGVSAAVSALAAGLPAHRTAAGAPVFSRPSGAPQGVRGLGTLWQRWGGALYAPFVRACRAAPAISLSPAEASAAAAAPAAGARPAYPSLQLARAVITTGVSNFAAAHPAEFLSPRVAVEACGVQMAQLLRHTRMTGQRVYDLDGGARDTALAQSVLSAMYERQREEFAAGVAAWRAAADDGGGGVRAAPPAVAEEEEEEEEEEGQEEEEEEESAVGGEKQRSTCRGLTWPLPSSAASRLSKPLLPYCLNHRG